LQCKKCHSSSSLNKTTTIQSILENHSELEYWRKKGLTAKQVAQWMKVADCNLESMIQYLCYCRFEMVEMGIEKSKPIRNVFNWFFRIIENSGCYQKPKDYKSYQEIKSEQERQIVEDKERVAKISEELYRKRIEAEREKEFYEMMNSPESDLYKRCFENLMSNQRLYNRASKKFETAMRNRFNMILNEDNQE